MSDHRRSEGSIYLCGLIARLPLKLPKHRNINSGIQRRYNIKNVARRLPTWGYPFYIMSGHLATLSLAHPFTLKRIKGVVYATLVVRQSAKAGRADGAEPTIIATVTVLAPDRMALAYRYCRASVVYFKRRFIGCCL